ncbi:DNA cytosine methyltransferase [Bacillus wiedmannii]|uniref:DNA cytosine methyltransferase n=1 Tax=Bacillus wiedmannii TaxID=1890302 RepID=UPI002112F189|nr:DNA (cytosine-5-)-methyltransferase [Bacillus wiedmannii]MCQ6546507.1 DNA cytosine methyltransferase [Bacillus wiedmannii]MCQ6574287.1 DNA cytosine methyltransferase [Bacillus wiedmannii]
MVKSLKKPTVVSIFCGAGGIDYGFQQAGFELILGINIDKHCCETYKNWSGAKVVNIDIRRIEVDQIPDSDVIIGAFPIPMVSFKKNGFEGLNVSADLINILSEIVKIKKPKAFVFENIRGLLSINKGKIFKEILNMLQKVGYDITYEVMNSEDYGVAQSKIRLIMVGVREDLCLKYEFPLKDNLKVTVREVLKDLEIKKKEERKKIEPEKLHKYNRAYKIIDLDAISPQFNISQKMVIRSDNGDYVSLLCEEAAAIQSFSKDVIFMGIRESKMRQIVQGCPPKLAFVIAEKLRDILGNKEQMDNSEEESIVNNHSSILFANSNVVNTTQISKNTRQLSLNLSKEKSIVNNNSAISFDNSNVVDTNQMLKKEKQESLNQSNEKKLDIGEKLILKINQINPGREQAQDYHD